MNLKKLVALAGVTAVVATGAVMFGAMPASAHTPTVTADCSTGLTVNLVDYSTNGGHPQDNEVTVTIDGTQVDDQQFGASFNQTYPLGDQYAAHTYEVKVNAWDGKQYDLDKSGSLDACKTDPAQPPAQVTDTDWVDGTAVCGDTTIAQTRTETTTPYVLVDHEWVLDSDHATSVTQTQTRPLSDAELAALQQSCAPPIPEPQQCTSTGSWYSEDTAPIQGEDGLDFKGQGTAVDYYQPVTGNLQGLGNQSITFANVSGYQPSFTIVFNREGNSGYANLVAEWYMNGGSPDTAGTFSIDATTKFWTNKIANPAPGSQSDPQPLSFFVQEYPNNELISLGAHLGSAQGDDTHSAVTAISGCASANFVPTKPADEVTVKTTPSTQCTPSGGTETDTTVTTTTPYIWDADNAKYVLDTDNAKAVTTISTRAATADECPVTTTTSTPPAAISVNSSPTGLADTGSNIDASMIAGGIMLAGLGFGIGLIIFSIRRRHAMK